MFSSPSSRAKRAASEVGVGGCSWTVSLTRLGKEGLEKEKPRSDVGDESREARGEGEGRCKRREVDVELLAQRRKKG